MDIGWYQVLTIVIANIGICFWMWREVRSDIKEVRSDMKEFRQDVKDFHTRLLKLEEKYLSKMDRRK